MAGGIVFNQWLIQEGYLVLKQRPAQALPLSKCEVDWARTRAWGEGGYYGRLYLNVRGREPQGTLPPEQADALKAELASKLEALCGPDGGKLGTVVLRPEKLYSTVNGIPPDLLIYFGNLDWRSVGSIGGPDSGIYTFRNDTGPDDANHAMEGIFILATKAQMKRGAQGRGELAGLRIEDVARTLLKLQGVPAPEGMGGKEMALD